MTQKIIAIVPAAGVGKRALAPHAPQPVGAVMPKQYRLLKGQTMLRHAVRALLADKRIAQVRVIAARDDPWVARSLDDLPRTCWRYCGGATRTDTVIAALEDAPLQADDWVLVHDAARPGLPHDALERLLDRCMQSGIGGLLAQPVADTVKRQQPALGGRAVRVASTLDREGLWLAQTPQMFRAGQLLEALLAARAAGAPVTDEASAIERAGHPVNLVQGSARNFKVTWPDDFALMECCLR